MRVCDALEGRDASAVDTLLASWALAITVTLVDRKTLAADALTAARTITVIATNLVVDAFASNAALTRTAVSIKPTFVARVDAQACKALLRAGAVAVIAALACESALVSDATEPVFTLNVGPALGSGVAESQITLFFRLTIVVALTLGRWNVDTQSVQAGFTKATVVIRLAPTGHLTAIVDALHFREGTISRKTTEELRNAAISQTSPVAVALVITTALDRLA